MPDISLEERIKGVTVLASRERHWGQRWERHPSIKIFKFLNQYTDYLLKDFF